MSFKFIFLDSVNATVISNATLTPDPVKSNETVTVTEGGGEGVKICNPDCPTNYYPINLTTNAPPNLPSNYSIVLAITGNKVPNIVTEACGFASDLSS
ncbi:hypothetical protein F8M41_020763 [Gigaspora margarita]|uniref:Uncharacterized protein n=1 Tax=Gigaspora margarita TaxID=4874 RepID=A0A8H4AI15_GIGMA|nr:hypothetical protein F8M41_020763 [Gigaspora margarita]